MEDNFKLEIISPERIIFLDEAKMVTLPSYEGDMSILKNHISIITLLRPGIIKVQKNDGNVTIDALSEKIIFSGLIISRLKFSSIKQLHLLPFFPPFRQLLQLYLPYKKRLRVNDRILLYI